MTETPTYPLTHSTSWLDNLRKEINEFSQTQSHDPTATATTTGIAGGVERLSSYGAQERKRIDSAPSSSQAAAAPVGYDRDTKTLPLPPSGVYRV